MDYFDELARLTIKVETAISAQVDALVDPTPAFKHDPAVVEADQREQAMFLFRPDVRLTAAND